MGVTRRYWGEAGLVVALAGLAVLFDRPLLLVGAGGVGGWLLARQYAFLETVSGVAGDLSVSQSFDRDVAAVESEVEVTVTVELPRPAPVALEAEPNLPPGVEAVERSSSTRGDSSTPTAVVPVGGRTATATFAVRGAVAGAYSFDPVTVTATDETGRFRAAFPAGPEPELTVEAHRPSDVHVGEGGTRSAQYGRHGGDERWPGIELAEIRAYVPGDAVRQIDWNATARLDEPHVREFETDTERQTAVLLDRRASMATGPEGGSKFDYLRQVALGIVGHARDRNEPIGLYEIGEQGLLAGQPPTATEDGYARMEHRLRSVEPQGGEDVRADERDHGARSPAVARRRTHRLRGDDSAFADRLGPFFAASDPYVEQVADDPLYGVARTHLQRLRGAVTAVVLTDDTHRPEAREVVKVARRNDDHVLAFLAPSVLFDSDAQADYEAAYDRYLDFEHFRRKLARLDRVTAFEVGPDDRLDALMKQSQRRAGTGD